MKEITEKYQPIEHPFYREIEQYRDKRKYIGIHYFGELHEYIYTTAIIKKIFSQENAEYILLTTGEEIRLDRIVRLDGKPAPGYNISDFTCDC